MKMITECADKLAHLGEKLFNETEMKYRAGDEVRIKSLDWYNENKGMNGLVGLFTPSMKKLCGKVVTLDSAYNGKYTAIEKEAKGYYLDDSMIEGYAKITDERLTEIAKDLFDKEEPFGLHCQYSCDSGNYEWKHEFSCPDGYEFRDENGNVIEAKKIVLKKTKPMYPQSYEECCKILNVAVWDLDILDNMLDTTEIVYRKSLDRLLNSFRKLLICRDAYWKIAGDWKPDWAMYSGPKHCIIYSDNQIKWQGKSFVTEAKVLAFPTDMMRDFFYENFKDLIEECKELI